MVRLEVKYYLPGAMSTMTQCSSRYPGVILLQSRADVCLGGLRGGLRRVQNISPVTALMQPLTATLNSSRSVPARALSLLVLPRSISHCSFLSGHRCCGLVLPCRTLGRLTLGSRVSPGPTRPHGLLHCLVALRDIQLLPHSTVPQWFLGHRAHPCLVPAENISCHPRLSSVTLCAHALSKSIL